MLLIHIRSQTSYPSPAYLKHAQTTSISLQSGEITQRKAHFLVALSTSHSVLNTVLPVRIGMVVGIWSGWQCIACWPCDHAADWELLTLSPLSIMREIVPCIASWGDVPNSTFQVRFLLNAFHFYTIIKSKTHKLSHHKLGPCVHYVSTCSLSRQTKHILHWTCLANPLSVLIMISFFDSCFYQ